MKLRPFLAGGALAIALVLTSCGGGSGAGSAAVPQEFTVTALEGLKFDKSEIDVAANQPFTVNFVNNGGLDHNFVIKNASGSDAFFIPGPDKTTYLATGQSKKSSAPITLPAGTYEFYCAFPGHEATMKGNVVVK